VILPAIVELELDPLEDVVRRSPSRVFFPVVCSVPVFVLYVIRRIFVAFLEGFESVGPFFPFNERLKFFGGSVQDTSQDPKLFPVVRPFRPGFPLIQSTERFLVGLKPHFSQKLPGRIIRSTEYSTNPFG
jgi:hypothetical protein